MQDFFAGIRDVIGGHSYEQVFKRGQHEALQEWE